MAFYDQHEFDIRCEWGVDGLTNLATSEIVVIVDVLSFSTSVEIALSRGVKIFPFPSRDEHAAEYADENEAVLAVKRSKNPSEPSLSPSSLAGAKSGLRLVLPSPNGSFLSFEAAKESSVVIVGSLRNAKAVSEYVERTGGSVSIIPAGERWEDDSLRPAMEDLLGAGAIISGLSGKKSAEAILAENAFRAAETKLPETLRDCSSGRELVERGFSEDVELASQLNVSSTVPVLRGNIFSSES